MESYRLTIPRLLGYLGFAVCETEVKELVRASARRDQLETLIVGSAGNQAGGLTVHLYCGVYRGWV
ncbi:hypothetical protein SBA2_30032 [Acidobacteriia bacterium SbA2]|nr:hypothetical protein SBA2_30032 [Acidobacteriia bacterium SbA2]